MSYNSSSFRRNKDANSTPADRGNAKVIHLQEMFPSWSDDDLKSLLSEVNYDLELAVTRISEGHAEQWGAVSRKKEKRPPGAGAGVTPGSDRGGFRGARGGRGGARGARGGGRGTARGGHRDTNGRSTPSSTPAPAHAPQASGSWAQEVPAATTTTTGEAANGASDASAAAPSAWGESGDASVPAEALPSSTWGNADSTTNPTPTPNAWANGASVELKSQAPSPAPAPASASASASAPASKPATSKRSWAQVARPQEKPKVAPAPAPPAAPPAPAPESTAPPAEPEKQQEPEAQGWEEPTTAQAPIWDDEPQAAPSTSDGWITSAPERIELHPEPASAEPSTQVQAEPEAEPTPEKETEKEREQEPEHLPAPSAFPAQLNLQKTESSASASPVAKSATPVNNNNAYARSVHSRAGNRFKATDQAVVMPSTFGSSVEKLGMQFGSVNLGFGGDEVDGNGSEPNASEPPVAPEQTREVQQQATHAPPPEPAPAPASPLTSTQHLFQQGLPHQTQQPQQALHPSSSSSLQNSQSQHAPPSLLPAQPQAQTASTATSTPLTAFATQQPTPSSQSSISPYQQQATAQHQQQQSQQQSQLHQQFAHFQSQAHLEQVSQQSPPQSQQPQQQPQQQTQHQGIGSQGIGSHNSYYRQPEQNFHHAATPPAGQAQEAPAPYGSFAPLSQQLGYQSQNSHLGGFGSDHFGYNESAPRGFYDSYGQQSGFGGAGVGGVGGGVGGGRNALGHGNDEIGKSIPGAQQVSQSGSGLPQSTSGQNVQQQTPQQPQSAAQPQAPTAGQPQQGYAPVPYYYNMYQPNQFYGPPYGSGYGLGQYANRYQPQQPPMFQPANPNPNPSSASPANANAKGPAAVAVQPQSNPYAPGLYGAHASSAYEDAYGHHSQLGPQHQHQHGHQHGHGQGEYSKPLYGGQGIQSFMGQSAPAGQLGQRGAAGGGSPENSYKPYGPGVGVGAKDVVGGAPGVGGVGVGSGIAGGQGGLGQGAARAGVQQPQHSQFSYAGNRFSANPSAGGPPGQQAQQQQQSQGYPQGGADNAFYYQRTAQSGPPYWG